jgi:hypothetical protein
VAARYLFLLAIAVVLAPAQDAVSFARDVQPILRKRCIVCHGAEVRQSGLRLDSRRAALEGGYSGVAIKPGDSAGSRLIALVSGKGAVKMPPAGPSLTEAEVLTLRRWIDQGADWPQGIDPEPPRPLPSHWAFRPVRKPALPQGMAGAETAIDAFVLARLQKEGITPSPEADRRTLLRRVSFDLIGLPPSPAESGEFMADNRDGAWERAVDRLLASPHFGERWARMWLDLARYADSDGYEQDQVRPHAWRYRDWVIRAFNRNLPFDRFTVEQIAGDLLPAATLEQKTATGFHRNTLTSREGGIDLEQLRTEQVADRAITAGSVWLGLTFECARCHDHKYDPLSQRDFYRFYAFFDNLEETNLSDPVPGEAGPYLRNRPVYEKKYAALKARYRVDELQPKWEREVLRAMGDPSERLEWTQVLDYLAVYQDHGHEILKTAPHLRTFRQAHDLTRVFLKYPGPLASWPEAKGNKFSQGFQELEELDARYPGLSEVPVVVESDRRRRTHLLLRGDFRSPGVEVTPGTPEFLPPPRPEGEPSRLALARWLVSPDNPLTARVFVNRVWQELFGRGLVTTPEDFGTRGDPPSHPELLDWLASRFRESNWNVKALIREIVLSSTYRRSSKARPDLQERDLENRLLARQNRLRLPAELIRDAMLSASDLLYPVVGGRSVRPPLPAGMLRVAYRVKWEESEGPERYRRGLYTFVQRSLPHPQLMAFDAPTSLVTCSRRERSTTPLQALALLNSPESGEAALALAYRILREAQGGRGDRLRHAFLLCLGREPDDEEVSTFSRYLDARHGREPEVDAWTGVAAILLNLDEFITRE